MPPQGPDSEPCRFFKKAAILQKFDFYKCKRRGYGSPPYVWGVGGLPPLPPSTSPLGVWGRKGAHSSLHEIYPIFFVSRKWACHF